MFSDILVKNFYQEVKRRGIFVDGEKILLAISGGPDSVCLLKLLLAIKKKLNLEISLVHVNYHYRGQDSDLDEKFIQNLAKKEGLELEVFHFDHAGFKKDNKNRKANLEEIFRNFRYRKFEELRIALKFDFVAVAHTLDDQAETFLINLFRGAGISGAKSLAFKNGKIIRPLLFLTKKEVLEYLSKIGQKFQVDKSNLNNDFLRNKIRSQLIPLIQKDFCVDFSGKVSQFCFYLQEIFPLVEENIKKVYSKVVCQKNSRIVFDLNKLAEMGNFEQSGIFRLAVKNLKGDLKEVSAQHFEEFKKVAFSKKLKKQRVEFLGLEFVRRRNNLVLVKKAFGNE